MKLIENQFQIKESEKIITEAKAIGVDIETYGHSDKESMGQIRLIQIAASDEVFVFDMMTTGFPEFLKQVFKNTDIVKIMHHGIFDMSHLVKHFQCSFKNTFCTAIASRLFSSGLDIRNSLKDVAARYLSIELDKKEQKSNWQGELTENQLMYAVKDAEILLPLYQTLLNLLKEKKLYHVGRLEFEIQEISARLLGEGIQMEQDAIARDMEDIRNSLPQGIPIDELLDHPKAVKSPVIQEALEKYNTLRSLSETLWFPIIKTVWKSGGNIYQKNFNPSVSGYCSGSVIQVQFKNLWLPSISVNAGDYKSRELLSDPNTFLSEKSQMLKHISAKNFKEYQTFGQKIEEYEKELPGIKRWQDSITSAIMKKLPVRFKNGRILHTRDLGTHNAGFFSTILSATVSDFLKTVIVMENQRGSKLIQIDRNNHTLYFSDNQCDKLNYTVSKASEYIFGSPLPSHTVHIEYVKQGNGLC